MTDELEEEAGDRTLYPNPDWTKCHECDGHYKFDRMSDDGWELHKCDKCGNEQMPETIGGKK